MLFLEIFDSVDNSLGFTSTPLAAGLKAMETLTISAAGIAYAIFGAQDSALTNNSAYADNFRFEPMLTAAAVPEPSTLISGSIAGLMGLACLYRLRNHSGS